MEFNQPANQSNDLAMLLDYTDDNNQQESSERIHEGTQENDNNINDMNVLTEFKLDALMLESHPIQQVQQISYQPVPQNVITNLKQEIDLYDPEMWNYEMKIALKQFQIDSEMKVLEFLFHFNICGQKLNLNIFDSKTETIRLLQIVLDPYRIKFQQKNNETEALCPWIMVDKHLCSLLIGDFPGSNGALIYQKLCLILHQKELSLKNLGLTSEQIIILRNSTLKAQQHNLKDSQSQLYETNFFLSKLHKVQDLLRPHIQTIVSLQQLISNVSYPSFDENMDDFFDNLAVHLASYPHRVEKKRDSSGTVAYRDSAEHHRRMEREMREKMREVGDQDEYSQEAYEEEEIERSYSKRRSSGGGKLRKQQQQRDFISRFQQPAAKRKRDMLSTSYDRGAKNYHPRLKRNNESNDRSKGRKIDKGSNWGKIIDYFSQETSSTNISAANKINSEQSRVGANTINLGRNLLKLGHTAPTIDSLFYKKQGQQAAQIKESSFNKHVQEIDQSAELERKIMSFDYKTLLFKFRQDKQLKANIDSQILKIQSQIGKSQILAAQEDDFYYEGQHYQLGSIASVIKAFRAYRETLQQFSLYASNLKIDQINASFNLFWYLLTNTLQTNSEDQKSDTLTKVKEEFSCLLNQFSIGEFYGIRSFEHQNCVMLHLIMVSGLLQQEGCQQVGFMEYVVGYLGWTAINGTAIEGRGKVEVLVLVQLLIKAFGGSNGIWEKAIIQYVTQQYINGKQLQSFLGVPSERIKHISFQEWKVNQKPFFQLNSSSVLGSLDIALYSYCIILLLENFIQQSATANWSLLSDLLSQHLSNSQVLSHHTLKLVHILLSVSPSSSTTGTLNQDQFLKLYQLSLSNNSISAQISNNTKAQRDVLLTATMNKWLGTDQQPNSNNSDLLGVYLACIGNDQRLVKQLYTKVIGILGSKANVWQQFQVQLAFFRAIDNESQRMIIYKKCMAMCLGGNLPETSLVQMIIDLSGAMGLFKDVDKSDLIVGVTSLIKGILSSFIKQVLKNKSNLNQNEYLLKVETNIAYMKNIYQALYIFNRRLRGQWKSNEFKFLRDAQLTEELFSIYAYLGVKPLDLEQLYTYYCKFSRIWLCKRTFKQQNSIREQDEDMIDDIIGESLVYEEQDSAMKAEIVNSKVAEAFERVMKSYRVSGRDVGVMVELQKINGAIDGLMIEQGEFKPVMILNKVQTSKQSQINDSMEKDQKQMLSALLVNCYSHCLIQRGGIEKICGSEIVNKDPNELTQITYNILENLIRGLLIIPKPIQDSLKPYHYSLKLYTLLKEQLSAQNQLQLVFKDPQIENQVLRHFLHHSIFPQKITKQEDFFALIQPIFSTFFQQIVKNIKASTKLIQTVNMYVGLIPILCKSQTGSNPYVDFLKSVMIQYMVTFQGIASEYRDASGMITQIIGLVMPSFFGSKQGVIETNAISIENNDSYYFFQYLSMQYKLIKTNEGGQHQHQVKQNMRQFLDLALRNIEANLNTLIPQLFLIDQSKVLQGDKEAISTTISFIKQECPVLKPLLDQISFNFSQHESFLSTVFLDFATYYLSLPPSSPFPYPQDLILKSQRKILCLLSLLCLLIVRVPDSSTVFTKALKLYTKILINDITQPEILISNNLNLLGLLQCWNLCTRVGKQQEESNGIGRLIARIIYEQSDKSKEVKRAQIIMEKIKSGRREGAKKECGFLERSAHQFLLSDNKMVERIIMSISFQLLHMINLDKLSLSLLSSILQSSNESSSSQFSVLIHQQIEKLSLSNMSLAPSLRYPSKFIQPQDVLL